MAGAAYGICLYCGSRTRGRTAICTACRDAIQRPSRRDPENQRKISLINAHARELGLSYGQYVARYGSMDEYGYVPHRQRK